MSRSSQPKRECFHAMSSVWMTTDPGTARPIRAASVVLPTLLRPSMARTTGRLRVALPGSRRVIAASRVLSSSARHGPASGSSGASCKAIQALPPAPARTMIDLRRAEAVAAVLLADMGSFSP